jgi:hypothetical protein
MCSFVYVSENGTWQSPLEEGNKAGRDILAHMFCIGKDEKEGNFKIDRAIRELPLNGEISRSVLRLCSSAWG